MNYAKIFLTTWGVKPSQIISHDHIKIKGIKSIDSKLQKTPRALNFIDQFVLGHQLARQI